MGKESVEPVAEAARRRLALLGEELARAGLAPAAADEADSAPADPEPAPVTPTVVPEPGRHARPRGGATPGRVAGWLQDRLPPGLSGRVGLGAIHLVVIALVLAIGLAVAAVLVLRDPPQGEVVPAPRPAAALVTPAPTADEGAGAGPGAGAGSGPEAGPPSPTGTVVVDVSGKVKRPGVATLPAGSRVVDALKRAGGARRGVDLSRLNLARVLVDGEQILVGIESAPGSAPSAAAAPGTAPSDRLVNINTASPEQLEELPGVGPVTAGKIVDWRTDHGAFTSVEDLLEVDGIGEKTLAQLAPHVTL